MQIPTLRLNGVPDAVWVNMPDTSLRVRIKVPTVDQVTELGSLQGSRNMLEARTMLAEKLIVEFSGVQDVDGNDIPNTAENRANILSFLPVFLFTVRECNRLAGWHEEGNAGNGSAS